LGRIAATGHRFVRTQLAWDVFMPSPVTVSDSALRDFELFIEIASGESLGVVPVLFAQSLGDCIMLPLWAVDVARPRPGVRVITGAVKQPGGPRDQYTDARMLEAETLWLDTMLERFAGHPALYAWDLGSDPATTVRPRHIADFVRWVAIFNARLSEGAQRSMLTLGTRDVTTARAVRPAALAPLLNTVGLAFEPADFTFAGGPPDDARRAVFAAQLAMRLCGGEAPLLVHLTASNETEDGQRASAVAAAFDGLVEVGCAGLFAATWSDAGERVTKVPPFDRAPQLRSRGVVDAAGEPTAFGDAWISLARQEHERRAPKPLPVELDAESYYANLPDSLSDLYAAWEREESDRPAMLE
jgi:hypothetical protein